MQVKTLGFLSLVGMLLTSAAVWSLTAPGPSPVTRPTSPPDTTDPPVDPRAGAQFTSGRRVMLEGRLSHAELRADRDQEGYVFLSARARSEELSSAPSPVNLAIVLDRSGSMRGKRLENALAAAQGMVDRLRDGDVVTVVTYNTVSDVSVAPTVIDAASRSRVRESIRRIEARGDTCISCAIDTATALLAERDGMVDRLLLLSDGEATAGVMDEPGFREIAAGARRRNVSISTIGVDVQYNERIMAALAQESNGRHYFVEDPSGLPAIFDQERQSLVNTVAKDAEVALELGPGVELLEVLDRAFRREGTRVVVPLGSFALGDEKTLLARIRMPSGPVGERLIADVRMSYRDLVAGDAATCDGTLRAVASDDASLEPEFDPLVEGRLLRSQTARTLTEANKLFREGKADAARSRVATTMRALRASKPKAVAAAPKGRARDLEDDFARQQEALGEASEGFAQPPPAATGAPASAPAKKGEAQVRKNQEAALDFGL